MVKITGFEDYSIDVYGNIYSNFKKDFLVPKIDKDGYHYVCLYKKGKEKWFKVHRLVGMMYIPNPDNLPQINHKDENKANNYVGNLEWCTNKYNVNYGMRTKKASAALGKKVYCYELDKVFNSMLEARKETGALKIAEVCRGKFSQSGGYHWKFVEE